MTAAQKELVMLWTLLSANSTRSPASGLTATQIFNGITADVRATLANGSWNWPGFGATNASSLIVATIQRESTVNCGGLGPYGTVIQDFLSAASHISSWSGGSDHPSVAELVAALGIS